MHKEIHTILSRAKNIFITSHTRCADATGSICALSLYAQTLGKEVYAFMNEPVPQNLAALLPASHITSQKTTLANFDVCLVVDAGDLKQTGIAEELSFCLQHGTPVVINIDHHKTNESFGHLNLVDKDASSTCELIYHFLTAHNFPVQNSLAQSLLTGIVGDTDNFTNAATTENSFKIAAQLILQGANFFEVIHKLFSLEESLSTLRLWGRIFERLTYNQKYDIAVSYVTQQDVRDCAARDESIEIVANLLNYIQNIKAGVLIKETLTGTYKVSLRSTYPGIDVSRLAKMLGGGGHKKAAGFTIEHPLFDFREKPYEMLSAVLEAV